MVGFGGREMNADDLVMAVTDGNRRTGRPIVWAVESVRPWLQANNLRTGERTEDPEARWNGALFETADIEACRGGRLQKWRRPDNGRVGWSLPVQRAEAERAAIDNSFERINATPAAPGPPWEYFSWDGEQWVSRGNRARP